MKLAFFFTFCFTIQLSANTPAQNITIRCKDASTENVLKEIEAKSGYVFLYDPSEINLNQTHSFSVKNASIERVLKACFKKLPIQYKIIKKTIFLKEVILSKRERTYSNPEKIEILIPIEIKGKVTDAEGKGIAGVTVLIKGTKNGVKTSADGDFSIKASDNATLVFSYVGYKTKEVAVNGNTSINVTLVIADNNLNQVVVSGIRESQQKALDLKRNSDQVLDAISAVDVGKLPDKNIAEALQRVSGVAIQRTRGQGDFISIRGLGPEFVAGFINGRTIVSSSESFNSVQSGGKQTSTGRETNFDLFPSEMVERIEVYKTPSAENTEGGIGGVVNIITAKPLTLANTFLFSARGEYNTFANKMSPDFSALKSWTNKKKNLGFLLGAIYSERNLREDNANSYGYTPMFVNGYSNTSNSIDYTTPPKGSSQAKDVYFPYTSNLESYIESRKRLTINSAFQYKISDKTMASFDFVYTRRNLVNTQGQVNIVASPIGFSASPTVNKDGSLQIPMQIDKNNNGNKYAANGDGSDDPTYTNQQHDLNNTYNAGIHLTHQTDNNWNLNFDGAYSKSAGNFSFKSARFSRPAVTRRTTIIPNKYVLAENNPFQPSDLKTRDLEIKERHNTDSEISGKADAEKEIKSTFLSSIKFGVRYSNREKGISENAANGSMKNANGADISLNLVSGNVPYKYGASNFLGGGFPVDFSKIIFPVDYDSMTDALKKAGGIPLNAIYNPNASFNVRESVIAGYLQLNLNGKLGEIPFSGNVGVRLVNTNVTVDSYTQAFIIKKDINNVSYPELTPGITTVKNTSSYLKALPSLNLKFDMSDNTKLRLGFSQTLSRPVFSDMGGLSVNYNNLFVNFYGNANLKPYTSTNYDVGFEWYLPGGGIFSSNFFYKELSSFVSNSASENVEFLGVTYKTFNQPKNQGKGNILGAELGYQQPFRFLPGFLSNLGIVANFTFSDGQLKLNDGSPVSFPGISRTSYNTALYYDDGKFEVRLAYTYRSQYLINPLDVFKQQLWQQAYGQLDGSISYKINKIISIFGDATNISNSINKTFSTNASSPAFDFSRPISYAYDGVRVAMGIKANLK